MKRDTGAGMVTGKDDTKFVIGGIVGGLAGGALGALIGRKERSDRVELERLGPRGRSVERRSHEVLPAVVGSN